ncbi:hypothetical protein N3M15_001826 [Salmonella enterica]|nr:hypothetical protein [Salmonella enterica]
MPLIDYIKKYYNGNQASFARLTGVQPAQVTQWLDKKFIVVDHTLYSRVANSAHNSTFVQLYLNHMCAKSVLSTSASSATLFSSVKINKLP